jgi:hypothetical protein
MKTLKITFAALALCATTLASSATTIKKFDDKLSMDYAIKTYVDALVHGKPTELAEVLDNNAKQTFKRGQGIVSWNKNSIVTAAKNNEGIEQNCQTSYSLVENLPGQVIVKVNQKYDNFDKSSYVTMMQTSKGWKITSISDVYNN